MKTGTCLDREKCSEILHLVMDGEATKSDEDYFHDHILQCIDCTQFYMLEQTIRNALRNKIDRKLAPEDFIHQLRMKIKKIQI
jgi:anti-sigma factor (TIGR02949 family)